MVWCEGQAKPNGRKGVGGAPDKWEVYFEFAVEFRKHTDDATDKTIAAAFVEKYRSAADELGLTDLLGPARAEKIRKARSDRKADGLLIDK